MNTRINKINNLIKKDVSDIFLKKLSLKEGVFVTLTKVDTSRDLRYTRIFISVFPETEINYVVKTLKKETFKIQGFLNKKLIMKPLPKISFQVDMTEARADEIEKLLKKI